MRKSMAASFYALVFLTVASPAVRAADKKITRDQLPEAVRKTADEQSQGASVRGYSKETEGGQIEYEVQLIANGHSKDVSIAPDGHVLEVEEQVALDALSPEVRSGLAAKAGSGKIAKVESITKHGAIVAYEAQVLTSGKHSEVQVGPDGKGLDHEE